MTQRDGSDKNGSLLKRGGKTQGKAGAQAGKGASRGGNVRLPGFENQNIEYLDAASLSRPLDMPRSARGPLKIVLVIAIIIGAVFLFFYFDRVVNAAAHEQKAYEQNIQREVTLDMPDIPALMPLDDAAIMEALKAEGYTLYEKTPVGSLPSGGFDVIKLPEGVSLAEAGMMYASGVDKLGASEASRLLHGAWDFTVNRNNGLSMRVRYAEFNADNIEKAMESCMNNAGLANAEIADSGVDDAGNTYSTGTIEHDGTSYTWRVSAVPLSEVYDIKNLPANAYYVGVRFTPAG